MAKYIGSIHINVLGLMIKKILKLLFVNNFISYGLKVLKILNDVKNEYVRH